MESPNNFLGRAARMARRMASRRRDKRSIAQNEMLGNFNALGGAGAIRAASGRNLAAGAANAAQLINTSQTQGANIAQAMANQVNNTVTPQATYDPLTQYNPASLDPTGGAALMPTASEAVNAVNPANASQIAMDMFGTPLARQRSMSNKYIKKIN